MSGLFSSLNASVSALSAQSRALETTGKNLANVNNPSYARQRVVFGDRGTIMTADGPESMGLQALGVEQVRDSLLDQQVMREVSLTSAYQTEQQAYQRAQAGLGQTVAGSAATSGSSSTDDNGIGAALDDFFNAFQSLAANPTDSGQRQTLLQSTSILTDRLHLADTRLAQVQSDLGAQVSSDVADTNRILQTVADLNAQIARFEANDPGGAVDLRDQRQAALEQLAAKLPIEVQGTNTSELTVVAKDASGADVVLVDHANVVAPLAFTGTQITAGASATVLGPSGGSIEGAITARDGAVQTLRDNLDALASQLVTSVNAAYNPTGSTGDFFTAAGTSAGTIQMAGGVTPTTLKASDGGAAGDNTVALAIAALATTKFSTTGAPPDAIDGTFSGHFAKSVSDLGQALAGANARVDDQTNIEKIVRTQRDGVSGVSLDEEMADLMKYQRAFQASSRVFSVMDDLLDTVVNKMG
ncbi:MAG TPA: flagellar hook-associated protein FlgK [Opitutaceae bacterium]|nr:flagellar hook-associated protein FlgK [Opitutaceae bacterium]